MTILRCTKFMLLLATWGQADNNAALSSLLSNIQAQSSDSNVAQTSSDLSAASASTGTTSGSISASSASSSTSSSNPLLSLLNAGSASGLSNLVDTSALTNSLGSLSGLTNVSALTNLADLSNLANTLNSLTSLSSLTKGLDVSSLTSGVDVSSLTNGLNVSGLLNQAGDLSNTFGELSGLASTANSLVGSMAGGTVLGQQAQELLSMAGAVSGIGSSVADLVNTTNALTDLSSALDTSKLLQDVSSSASNPLSLLTSSLTGTSTDASTNTSSTSVSSSLVKAFITNGYLNQAGQSAMRLSGIATQAYQYQDLANALSGAAPAVDSNGQLTTAVQRALAEMGINVTTPEELISYAMNKGLSSARRLGVDHPTFREAILNFNNALSAAMKSQTESAEADHAQARLLQGAYSYMPPQGMPLQAPPQGMAAGPAVAPRGVPPQVMMSPGMYPQMGYINPAMAQRYGNQMYGGQGPVMARPVPQHNFMGFDSMPIRYGDEMAASGAIPTFEQPPSFFHMPPMGSFPPSGPQHFRGSNSERAGEVPTGNSPQPPTRPEYQLLEQIASQPTATASNIRFPGRRLQSWLNDTLGALVSILDEERPEWKTDVQNAAQDLANQFDSIADSLRSGDLPDKVQSLWQSVSARAAEISEENQKKAAESRRLQEIYMQQVGLPLVSALTPFMSLASPFLNPLQSPLQASALQFPNLSSFGGLTGSGLGLKRRLTTEGNVLPSGAQTRTAFTSAGAENTVAGAQASTSTSALESLLLDGETSGKSDTVQAAGGASDIMSVLSGLPGTTDITAALSSLLNSQSGATGISSPLGSATSLTNPLGTASTLTNPLSGLTSQTASITQPLTTGSGNSLDVSSLLSSLSGTTDTSSLINTLLKSASGNASPVDLSSLLPTATTSSDLVSSLSSVLPSASSASTSADLASSLSNLLPSTVASSTGTQPSLGALLSGTSSDATALPTNLDLSALTASLNNLLPHQRRLQSAAWPFSQIPAWQYGGGYSPEFPGYGFYPMDGFWQPPYNMQPPGTTLGGLLQQSLGQPSVEVSAPRDSASKELQMAPGMMGNQGSGMMGAQTPGMMGASIPGMMGPGTVMGGNRMAGSAGIPNMNQGLSRPGTGGLAPMRGQDLRGSDNRRRHDRNLRRLSADISEEVNAETINERLRAQSAKAVNQASGGVPSGNVTDSAAIASAVQVLSQTASADSSGVDLQEFLNTLNSENSTVSDIAAAVTGGLPSGLSLSDLTSLSDKLGITVDPVLSDAVDALDLGTSGGNSTNSTSSLIDSLIKPLESLGNSGSIDSLLSSFGSFLSAGSTNASSHTNSGSISSKILTDASDGNTSVMPASNSSASSASGLDLSSLSTLTDANNNTLLTGSSTSNSGSVLDINSLLSSALGSVPNTIGSTSQSGAGNTLDVSSLLGLLSGTSSSNTTSGLNLGSLANATHLGSAASAASGASNALDLSSLLGIGNATGISSLLSGSSGVANSLDISSLLNAASPLNASQLLTGSALGAPGTFDLASLLNLGSSSNVTSTVSNNTELQGDGNAVGVQPITGSPSLSGLLAPTLAPSLASLGIAPANLNLSDITLPASLGLGGLDLGNLTGGLDLGNLTGGLDLENLAGILSNNKAGANGLSNLDLSNLGNLDLSNLGNLDLSNLGNLHLSNLGNLDLSNVLHGVNTAVSTMSPILPSQAIIGGSNNAGSELNALLASLNQNAGASLSGVSTVSPPSTLAAARRMLSQVFSDEDRSALAKGLEAPVIRQSLASLLEKNQLSDSLKSEISSVIKSQLRSLQSANTYGLSTEDYTRMQGLLGTDASTWLDALNRIESRGVDLSNTKISFDSTGSPKVGTEGIDLAALKTQLESGTGSKETLSAGVSLSHLAEGLAGSGVDLNALVHNVTSANLDINGVLRIMDITGVDMNELVRGLESAQDSDPAILKEILDGSSGQGINYQSLSQAINLLESINPMLGLSSLANNADIKHAMQVLNLTDISPLIGSNPLALFQPKVAGIARQLGDIVDELKAKAGTVETLRLISPAVEAQRALSHANQQRMLLEASGLPAKNSVVLAPHEHGHRRLESMSPSGSAPASMLQSSAKAQPVDIRFDGSIKFVSASTEGGKFIASTGDLGYAWNFDQDSSLVPPVVACWSVNGQAESPESWPSIIVQSASLDIIDKASGSIVRTLDLSRPDSENVFEYYSPGWNVTQAWLKKRNDSCAWVPMCYLMDQLAQLKSYGPLSASLSLLADRVPPSKQVEIQDARVVVRSVASQGVWEQASAESSQIPIGAVLSPPVASITKVFDNTPVFSFELPKPSESTAVQGSGITGYAVLASAESTGLTFVFDESSWNWIPESAHPAYARILDQLKTFDDKFQGEDLSDEVGSEEDEDDYEASAIAMFNAKRDLPIKVNEWTYIPRFVLETVAYTPERNYIVQKCLPLTGMSSSLDPLASTIFEMLYSNGGALETSVQMKTFMEAAPIQAMVSSQEGNAVFDMRNSLIDDYSSATWRVNVSLSKIYPTMRGQGAAEASSPLMAAGSGSPCASGGECDLWQL